VQAAAAGTDQVLRLNHLLDPGQVFRQRSAIGGTRLCRAPGGPILGIFLGVDRGDGRFQIFQRQFERVRIALLRPPPEDRLPEGRNQLLEPRDPLILALVVRLRSDQHRLQRGNFLKKISALGHGAGLP
jgi:hypothetical protein